MSNTTELNKRYRHLKHIDGTLLLIFKIGIHRALNKPIDLTIVVWKCVQVNMQIDDFIITFCTLCIYKWGDLELI